jgi:hypothetical protein
MIKQAPPAEVPSAWAFLFIASQAKKISLLPLPA